MPIVGQPLEVLGWTLIVYVQCKSCQPPQFVPLTVTQLAFGRTAGLGICPGCARAMHVQALGMNAQNQLEFNVELGEAPQTPGRAS